MHKKAARKLAALVAQLEALYAQVPPVACIGKCAKACRSIPLVAVEARRLQAATHVKPRTVGDDRCVYLTPAGRCSAYAVRPFICRAYGLVSSLTCPFGCTPATWLDSDHFLRLAQAIERLGGRLLRTTDAGVEEFGDSFLRIENVKTRTEMLDDDARLRGLRALHGGYILAATKNHPAVAGHEPKPVDPS